MRLTCLQDPTPAPSVYTEETFRFLALPELWVVGLVIVPLLIAFAWWSYGGLSRLEQPVRVGLSIVRGLAVLACLLALFQPAWEQVRYSAVRTQVHVLVDDSASMSRHDTYPDMTQRTALMQQTGEDVSRLNRVELVAKVLSKPKGLLDQLKQNHEVRLFKFVRKPAPIGSLDELSARGSRSPLGDALDLHLGASGAANLDAVILVSDGRSNAGLAPIEVAGKYRSNDLAIYTIGVGDPSPPRNVRLSGPPGPREALRLEEVAFDVTVSSEGLEGRAVTVTMFGERAGSARQPLESATTSLLKDGEPQRVRLYHAFEDAGDWTLRFEVTALPEETTTEDNVDTRFLRVTDERIRVLYLEGFPRWEYRYLKNALLRVDKSIEAQVFLFDASRDFVQEHSKQLPPLREMPSARDDLFAYHVILIGDVLPEQLAPTEDRRQAWLSLLTQFVERGGGLGVIWGEMAMPDRYRSTPLEDLLPVVLEEPDRVGAVDWSEPFTPEIENPKMPHDVVLLMREPERNESLWRDGLAPLIAYYPVQQAKAGSTVLLRHPKDSNRFGKRPILTVGEVPRGRTLFLATDETWRWREPYGEKYHDPFWRNVVRHLAAGRLRRRDDRVELRLDRVLVDTGEQVRVQLKLLDTELTARRAAEATVFFRRADGQPERRTLQAAAPETGEFEGRFTLQDPGAVSVLVFENDNPDGQLLAREDVLVKVPDLELARSSQDREALEQIAAASKDGFYSFLADTDRLAAVFKDRRPSETEVDRSTKPLWDHWWTLAGILLLLTIEWIARKRVRLV